MMPAAITTGVVAFRDAVAAAKPLNEAGPLQVAALIQQGQALLRTIDAAVAATGLPLDAADLAGPPTTLADRILAVLGSGADHATLHDLRGFVGRAVFNLEQSA